MKGSTDFHGNISIAINLIVSISAYILLSLQRYQLNILYIGILLTSLTVSIIITFKYLLRNRRSIYRLISLFIVFLYVAAAERNFILISTLSGFEIYLGGLILSLITINMLILFYFTFRGDDKNGIVKMEYGGYA